MGTNFYMMTRDKTIRDKWIKDDNYHLTDCPDWGYEIHVAKTSAGWKPLFESHHNIHSVAQYKQMYDNGFAIHDEYGRTYTWDEFKERVIDWNKDDPDARSHLDYSQNDYYFDHEGYEFTDREFS